MLVRPCVCVCLSLSSSPPPRPCVLIRTPYNKSAVNPDLRNPGVYWTQNGYCCFLQDCRGRFKSEGEFYKYTGEANDGYDTVEWIAMQVWCNESVVTDGPSYLCHVQTSMALLRPPHLRAMFCNKGGFFNAHTSGVRNGGSYEARQWVWALKNASRRNPIMKEALESTEKQFDAWLKRYPFRRGDSPLSIVPDYESYIFDQVENADYNTYWKQIGLNTEEHIDAFADIPALFFSGWYDIYCRSTIDFFTHLVHVKKGPILLIMGPWQHVGPEGHVAGEVDFGVNALVSGNLAPNMYSLSRRWFDRWVTPATSPEPKKMTPQEKLEMAIRAAEQQQQQQQHQQQQSPPPSTTSLYAPLNTHGPYTSLSRVSASHHPLTVDRNHTSLYLLPAALPKDRANEPIEPLPPAVRYFRMGGGDGHRTTQGCLFHGGVWMQAPTWPPPGTTYVNYFLERRALTTSSWMERKENGGGEKGQKQQQQQQQGEGEGEGEGESNNGSSGISGSSSSSNASSSSSSSPSPPFTPTDRISTWKPVPIPISLHTKLDHCVTYPYDPRNPCPTLGGNLFGHKNILLAGAFDQVERSNMFLCSPPYLPLASRRDVCVFRTSKLQERLDVTGMVLVILYISSTALDTDFTAKLIDEYPPSADYPHGFAMQITHGIRRCRYRNRRDRAELMAPGNIYQIVIELYPTSNLFAKGHRLRVDISSSNYPHFDLNMNTGDEFESQRVVVAENTVWYNGQFPSRIILPVQTKTLQAQHAAMEEAPSSVVETSSAHAASHST